MVVYYVVVVYNGVVCFVFVVDVVGGDEEFV